MEANTLESMRKQLHCKSCPQLKDLLKVSRHHIMNGISKLINFMSEHDSRIVSLFFFFFCCCPCCLEAEGIRPEKVNVQTFNAWWISNCLVRIPRDGGATTCTCFVHMRHGKCPHQFACKEYFEIRTHVPVVLPVAEEARAHLDDSEDEAAER